MCQGGDKGQVIQGACQHQIVCAALKASPTHHIGKPSHGHHTNHIRYHHSPPFQISHTSQPPEALQDSRTSTYHLLAFGLLECRFVVSKTLTHEDVLGRSRPLWFEV